MYICIIFIDIIIYISIIDMYIYIDYMFLIRDFSRKTDVPLLPGYNQGLGLWSCTAA